MSRAPNGRKRGAGRAVGYGPITSSQSRERPEAREWDPLKRRASKLLSSVVSSATKWFGRFWSPEEPAQQVPVSSSIVVARTTDHEDVPSRRHSQTSRDVMLGILQSKESDAPLSAAETSMLAELLSRETPAETTVQSESPPKLQAHRAPRSLATHAPRALVPPLLEAKPVLAEEMRSGFLPHTMRALQQCAPEETAGADLESDEEHEEDDGVRDILMHSLRESAAVDATADRQASLPGAMSLSSVSAQEDMLSLSQTAAKRAPTFVDKRPISKISVPQAAETVEEEE
ncbi:MAG: hypothetical protein MHM6MM_008770, partial [Cercozoa sp. M6MM]